MGQNEKFVAPNAEQNCTLFAARKAAWLLGRIGIPTYGIVAVAIASQDIVEEADFAANGIDPNVPARLEVRTSWGNGPDESGEENAIADFGAYQNAALVMAWREQAKYPDVAAARLMATIEPGISDAEVTRRLMNLPGVAKAFGTAVGAALD